MVDRSTLQSLFCAALAAVVGIAGALACASPAMAATGGAVPGGKKINRTPVIAAYRLDSSLVDGQRLGIAYRITAPARRVRVRAVVRTKKGRYVKTVQLGVRSTNVRQSRKLGPADLGISRSGRYRVRISARDGRGRAAKRAKNVPAWLSFNFSDHRFPLGGAFSFGGDGARFGAGRPGHIHQGQDLVADAGAPIVAPFSGEISWVAYQAGGAGYYVVEHADDGRDYVFMHLAKDSTAVSQGQRVRAGARIGRVGDTGAASGPHLHFEIWTGGPWQFGGKPIDPLPLLRSWLRDGPGGAVRTSAAATIAAPADEF